MIYVVMIWLAMIAFFLELCHRAPVRDDWE